MSGCQVASAAGRSVSRPPAAAPDATRYGRRRFYCGRAPPLLRLLLLPPPPPVLLYSQFGTKFSGYVYEELSILRT